MFCRYCGTQLEDDSVFCAKCGKNITKSHVESKEGEQVSKHDSYSETNHAENALNVSLRELYSYEWKYYTGRVKHGPYTREEMIMHIRNGKIKEPSTLVYRTGFSRWVPIGETTLFKYMNPNYTENNNSLEERMESCDYEEKIKPSEVSDKWMWLLATLPILIPITASVFGISSGMQTFIHIILNCLILAEDTNYLSKNGLKPSGWLFLGFILVPLYMGVRAGKTNKHYGPLILWCVLFLFECYPGILFFL